MHLPNFGRRSLESSDGIIRLHIENPNEAVDGSGGGDPAGGMGGDGDDAEAVAGVGTDEGEVAVGVPEADGLVEGAGEEERRRLVGRRCPRGGPD